MKLEVNNDIYWLPPIGILVEVFIRRGVVDGFPSLNELCIIFSTLMAKRKQTLRHGVPTTACLLKDYGLDARLQLEPTPNEEGELIVHYYPPIKEV